MIDILEYPDRNRWKALLERPAANMDALQKPVREILDAVKANGDQAVRAYAKRFDKLQEKDAIEIPPHEWEGAGITISPALKAAIDLAIANIRTFHAAQKEEPKRIETAPGVTCWRQCVAIEKVGLYIPGGTAPLFSTLMMLSVPAQIAGCKEIIVCTPAHNGKVHPAILYIALQTGVHRLFGIGGVQAIGAMAYGTETMPQVHKIFGPGNAYVTCAKMLVQADGIAIDMPAGPSEVAVLADDSCVPAFVAADLLSQAEHGADSQVMLVSDNKSVIEEVLKCLQEQLDALPRKELAAQALQHSKAILVKDLDEGMTLLNAYAPEHLIMACRNAEMLTQKVMNAGSVFIGNYAPESAGDYASGTNHTLPTNGYARSYSGVSLDSFVRKITFQQLSRTGLENIGGAVMELANAEGLEAHARAVSIRLQHSNEQP